MLKLVLLLCAWSSGKRAKQQGPYARHQNMLAPGIKSQAELTCSPLVVGQACFDAFHLSSSSTRGVMTLLKQVLLAVSASGSGTAFMLDLLACTGCPPLAAKRYNPSSGSGLLLHVMCWHDCACLIIGQHKYCFSLSPSVPCRNGLCRSGLSL